MTAAFAHVASRSIRRPDRAGAESDGSEWARAGADTGTDVDPMAASGVRPRLSDSVAPGQDSELLRRLGHTDRLAQIGVLTATIAHELNNPAAFVYANLGIMGDHVAALVRGFQVLEQAIAELTPNRRAAYRAELERADVSGRLDEMGEICDDNLAGIGMISEIVASLRGFARDSCSVSAVAIQQVVEEATRLVARSVEASAELVLDLEAVPPFPGDSCRLTQVVTNLLVNAAQAIEEGGTGRCRITVSSRVEGGACVVRVLDSGPGISPEIRDRIFEPFFTTKATGEGTGLGLALCRDIARQHGGTLSCRSAPGEGSCFELVIPLDPPTDACVHPTP